MIGSSEHVVVADIFPSYEIWNGALRPNASGSSRARSSSEVDGSDRMTTFSGSESSVGNDSDDEPNLSFLLDVVLGNQIASTLGNRNRDKFKNKAKGGKLLRPNEDGYLAGAKRYVTNIPASKLKSTGFLHPACLINLEPFNDISSLAEILGLRMDEEMSDRIQNTITNSAVRRLVNKLLQVGATGIDYMESEVEGAFGALVDCIIEVLQSKCVFKKRIRSYCVGGVVADELCAVVGDTDYFAVNESGDIAFMTECKRDIVHPFDHKFYKGNVGIQFFSAFYSTDFKPTFLYTQKNFVLLARDVRTGKHMKFPEGLEKFGVYSLQFLTAITLCLLASSPGIRELKSLEVPVTFITTIPNGNVSTAEKMKRVLQEGGMEALPFSLSKVPKTSAEGNEGEDDILPLTSHNLNLLNASFRKHGQKLGI